MICRASARNDLYKIGFGNLNLHVQNLLQARLQNTKTTDVQHINITQNAASPDLAGPGLTSSGGSNARTEAMRH